MHDSNIFDTFSPEASKWVRNEVLHKNSVLFIGLFINLMFTNGMSFLGNVNINEIKRC